jgi:hypothetical protein
MPYNIRKQKCKQSDGDAGKYTLSYTDNKGKKHRACHTSRKKARGQIAAIEAEGAGAEMTAREAMVEMNIDDLRMIIRELVKESVRAQRNKKRSSTDHDRDGDKDSDFADVLMARMKAGGESDEEALKKSRKYNK